MRDTNRENGITLIALVITIIVLIILASIGTYSGISTIQSSKLNKFKQQLEIMQAQVDLLYEECKNSDGTFDIDKINSIGKDLSNLDTQEVSDIFDSFNIDNTDDYRYYDAETLEDLSVSGIDDEYLVSVIDRMVISINGFESDGKLYRNLYEFPDKVKVDGELTRGDVSFSVNVEKVSSGWNVKISNINFSKYVGKGVIQYRKATASDWITLEKDAHEKEYIFNVENWGEYVVRVIDAAGIFSEQEFKVELGGSRFDEDTTITIGDEEVSIPGGSTISKIPGEYENIDEGLVIYIIPDEVKPDWEADENNNGILDVQEKYDQFVWVPVPNPVLDLSGNATALSSGVNIKAEVQKEIDAGRYPMAIKKNGTDYFGIFYEFDEGDGGVKIEPYEYWTPLSEANNREPAYLSDTSFADGSSYNNIQPKLTENLLQQEYNIMVEKVSKQKGFWVGRYETSNMINDNAKDTSNKIRVIKGTTDGINKVDWYRMYAQQKSYRNLTEISSTRTSSMIWGSQWDQIMIWMRGVENEAQNSYYIVNSQTMGNFDINHGLQSGIEETGYYKVKNIYDLAGNIEEWTVEADSTGVRVNRRR